MLDEQLDWSTDKPHSQGHKMATPKEGKSSQKYSKEAHSRAKKLEWLASETYSMSSSVHMFAPCMDLSCSCVGMLLLFKAASFVQARWSCCQMWSYVIMQCNAMQRNKSIEVMIWNSTALDGVW